MSRLYLLFLGLLLAELNDVNASEECGVGSIVSDMGCTDEDECEDERCGPHATCFNTEGSYYCQCVTGYKINKPKVHFTAEEDGTCGDFNECRDIENICGPNAECTNSIGSYFCTCLPGFVASNGQNRFNATQNVTCEDINECSDRNICGPNTECINIEGSYYCTCFSGFVASNGTEPFNASQNVTCDDKDECELICGKNANCYNIEGSYYCQCVTGYRTTSQTVKFTQDKGGQCIQTPKSPDNKNLGAPDAEFHKTSVYCMEAESSTTQQQFHLTVLVFLPLILWMFYQ